MAHYAFIDENNIVTQVIVGKNEGESGVDWEEYYGDVVGMLCKRTSYNTWQNTHRLNGIPFRGNYAGIGYIYLPDKDVFIEPQPYPSWILDESTWSWKAPVEIPSDAFDTINGNRYDWNEDTLSWVIV